MIQLYIEICNELIYIGEDYMIENIWRIIGFEEHNLKTYYGLDMLHWMAFRRGEVIFETVC
jgi:hypothetical protein